MGFCPATTGVFELLPSPPLNTLELECIRGAQERANVWGTYLQRTAGVFSKKRKHEIWGGPDLFVLDGYLIHCISLIFFLPIHHHTLVPESKLLNRKPILMAA